MAFQTILVAIDDFSSSSCLIQALDEFDLESRSRVILAHVVYPDSLSEEKVADRPHQSSSQEMIYRELEKQLLEWQKKIPCESEIEIVTGEPAEEIIRLSNIYKADLIAIGSRGLKGMKRIVLGSVSSQVVAEASCSVLVVKQ